MICFFFFFSSRRRHTRLQGDWSSDVCSSDLDLFVTAEVAAAFVLVVMTVLLLRSLLAVQQIQPGFDPQHVTTAYFLKPANDPGFLSRLQTELRSSPGIQSAALINPAPFTSNRTGS